MVAVLILGGLGVVAGLAAGFALGGLARPFLVAELAGLALAGAYYVWIAATSERDACHDCGDYLGVYTSPVTFLFLGMNLLGWLVAAPFGVALRLRLTRTERVT